MLIQSIIGNWQLKIRQRSNSVTYECSNELLDRERASSSRGAQPPSHSARPLAAVCLPIFMILPVTVKCVFHCLEWLNQTFQDFNRSRRLNLTLGSTYISFKLSLQSHPLWVTLYFKLTHFLLKKYFYIKNGCKSRQTLKKIHCNS